MTTKGQHNHYNIKVLRGYGVSISLKNNHLVLKNGQNDITGISDKEEWFVSKIPYEKIVNDISNDPLLIEEAKKELFLKVETALKIIQ